MHTPTGVPCNCLCGERDPRGIDADRRELPLRRFAAELLDLARGRIRFEQRVIDVPGHAAGAAVGGVQSEARRAGIDDVLHAIGTALGGKAVTGASRRRDGPGASQLLENELDHPAIVGHGILSSARIFARRRIYRASPIGVASHVSTIAFASSTETSVAPSARTLAPLCSRA